MEAGGTREDALAAGLVFAILIWIAGADGEVRPEEVEIFQRMLARRSWCKSKLAHRVFPAADEAYPALWQSFARKDLERDTAAIERGLWAAGQLAAAPDFELFKQDLRRLAQSIARAAGGFLGLGSVSREERAALDRLDALFAAAGQGAPTPASLQSLSRKPEPLDSATIEMQAVPSPDTATPRWVQGRIRLNCIAVVPQTHDVKTFRFVGEPRVQFVYQPGQFITLDLSINGEKIKRSYSISSTPTRPAVLEITVKRVPGGLVSNWLHDNVQPGFRVNVSGPSGRFSCLPDPAPKLLLLSAGSGVTPVMAMARYLFDTGSPSEMIFLHSARSLDDVPFAEELQWMAERSPRFIPHLVLTRPSPDVPWKGPTGRLSPKMVVDLVPDYRQRILYSCGPTPFMEHARELMADLGFPMKNFHMESFGGSKGGDAPKARKRAGSMAELLPTPTSVPVKPKTLPPGAMRAPVRAKATAKLPKVLFARSGREVAHDGETPLLELAERLGGDIPNACRAGVCGTCKMPVLSGEVRMTSSDGLSAADKAAGKVLTCVGLPVGEVVVDC